MINGIATADDPAPFQVQLAAPAKAFGKRQGYPKERVVPEQRNKKILDGVRSVAFRDLCDILKDLDRDLVKGAFAGEHFAEHFFADCKDEKIAATVKELMA